MLEFVNELINSQDNIIDQLKALKENKNHKEVKKYMRVLVQQSNSPYYKYCIDKYYFNRNVSEVKPPIPTLRPLYYLKGSKKIEKLLETKDNIIDQLKLLKEHKGTKIIDNYIEEYLAIYSTSQYEVYCIQKYYYDMDVEEVEPTAKNLNITLYKIHFQTLRKIQENEKIRKRKKFIKKVKEGDKVKMLDGPFGGMTGIIKSFDIDNLKIVVTIELFETKYDIEYDEAFEIIKEDKNEK